MFNGRWNEATLTFATDTQNTAEVNLGDAFEAIEVDIPTIEAAELQIKGANSVGGTFDLIGADEPVQSSTGGFRTTIPLGGKYQYIKVYLSAAQTANRTFNVRGVSYASGGLVAILDKIKQLLSGVVLAAGTATIGWVLRKHDVVETPFTDTGNLAAATNKIAPAAAFKLLEISLHLNAAPTTGAQTLTLALDDGVAAAYDLTILAIDLVANAVTDLIVKPNMLCKSTDVITAVWTNTDGKTYGLKFKHELV